MIDLSKPELLDLIDACETHKRMLDAAHDETDEGSREWRDYVSAVLRITKLRAKLRQAVTEG